jgi:sulfate permease, SulP family
MLADRLRQYRHGDLRDDLLAAFIVAILLIPQSLAYALLAGLPPQVGVYASLLPMVAYALLGSSRVNSVGPVAVVALMTAQAIAPALREGTSATAAALVLAAESGLLLAGAALLKLDALAALLSTPVLHGFSTGAALAISLSQLPALLGSPAQGFSAPEVIGSWWRGGRAGHALTTAIGIGALLCLWLARHHAPRFFARWLSVHRASLGARCLPLVVVAAGIVLAWALGADTRGVALVGTLPPFGLPLALPPFDAALWWRLRPSAAPLALVTFVSSLAVSEGLALRRREQVDARRELAGLAGANLAAALCAGMPVGGSFSRGAVNAEAGARTRASGVWAAGFMALAMLLLAAPLACLPRAVLAASIVIAVLGVVEWRAFAEAWRYSRSEFAVMVIVGALTLLTSSQLALAVGVALSIGLLLQRSANPHVARIGRVGDTEHYRNVDRHAVHCTPGVLALRIDESLIFTNARRLAGVVAQHLASLPDTRRVVLLMSPVNAIDYSALEALRALHDVLAERGIRLDLSEVKGPVLDRLREGGWARWFSGRVFLSHHQGMLDVDGRAA